MTDANLSLGTIFTANITDFLQKTRMIRSELNRFATVSNQLATGLRSLNQAVSQQTRQTSTAVAATQKVNKAHEIQGKQISGVVGGWNRLAAAMKVTASYGAAATMIYGVTKALRTGVDEIVNYDQALMNIQAITGATNAELEIMSETILEVAKRTKYSATEVAEGMVLLGQAGFSATESISAIGAVSDLAAGTLSNLKDTTDLLSTTIRAYNLDAIESGRVADVMANAINKSKLTIDKLRIAFNYVGATAGQVGMTLEETAASMMVLANNGLRASTIGTGLRQVLSKLLAPTDKIKDAFEEYGISLEQVNPSIVGFQTAMKNLRTVLTDKSGMIDMTKAFELFQLRGAQAAAIIASSFTDGKFQEALDKAYEVGSAAEMMQKQSEGLAFKFKNLADRAKNLAISLGHAGVAGVMEVFVDILRETIDVVTYFTDSVVGQSILQIGIWTATIYGAGVAFRALAVIIKASSIYLYISNLVGVFGALAKTMGKLGASWSVLKTLMKGNIWLIVASAVAAVGVALYNFGKRAERAQKEAEKVTAETRQAALSLKMYREAIEKTNGTGREYESLLKRLKEAHPELAKVVEENANSYQDLTKAMKEAEDVNFKKSLMSQLKEVELLGKKLKEVKESYDYYSTPYERYLTSGPRKSPMKEFIKESEEGAEILKTVSQKYKTFAYQIWSSLEPDTRSWAPLTAETLLDSYGYNQNEIKSAMDQINKYFDEFEKNRIANATRAEAQYRISEKAANKKLAQEKKFYMLMSQMADDERKQVEDRFGARAAEIDRWYKDEIQRLTKLGEETVSAKDKYDLLVNQNKKKRAQDLAKIELDESKRSIELKKFELERKIEIEKQVAADNATKLEQIKSKETELQISSLKEIESAYKKYYEKIVSLFGKESKEAIEAKKLWVQQSVDLERGLTDKITELTKKRIKEQVDNLKAQLKQVREFSLEWKIIIEKLRDIKGITEEEYAEKMNTAFANMFSNMEKGFRSGKVSADDYIKYLNEALNRNIITYEQYTDKRIAADKSWLAAFRHGLKKANQEQKTWSETFAYIGENISDQISNNLTSGWLDWIEGTKSATKAFQDFAKSTLRWLSELIMKRQLYNLVSGIVTGYSSSGGSSSSYESINGIAQTAHSGAKIGKSILARISRKNFDPTIFDFAPRLHSGLKADEYPTILKRGEEVRSVEEVRKGDNNPSLQVIINEAPPGTKVREDATIPNLKKLIIDVGSNDVVSGGKMGRAIQRTFGLGRTVTAR